METPESAPVVVAKTIHELVKMISDTTSGWTEPAKIRRVAAAKADETRILTAAEIQREALLSEARYRMEVVEIRRQKNLEEIASIVAQQKGPILTIEDQDWLVGFVESCKDTSDPTLRGIWAKLLAGEMEAVGSCSKRTLQMVKALSRGEALLIKDMCRRVCVVEESDGQKTAFLNVFVNRLELDLGDDAPQSSSLYADDVPDRRRRDDRLVACGFLASDDFRFTFSGEGFLDPARFQLSSDSPKRITMGSKTLVADTHQPGLLFESKKFQAPEPRIRTPAATIEFDAWKLSAEGEELYRALNEVPDYSLLKALREGLVEGGLSISESQE